MIAQNLTSETSVAERHLEQAAHQLAVQHHLSSAAAGTPLRQRLPTLYKLLKAAYQQFSQSTDQEVALSYAAEWLLDNFYIIEQSLQQVDQDLPDAFYRQLPLLEEPANRPRVYILARTFIEHELGRTDNKRLERFVLAYQHHQPLTMGEVWALPIMLRLTLLESLAEVISHVAQLPLQTDPPLAPYTHQASDSDIVANSITSLRQLNSYDWKEFFENVSLVEHTLRRDPSEVYGRMDFATRDQYRKVVEKLAQRSQHNEISVAATAVQLAQASFAYNGHTPITSLFQDRTHHVGYYLIDNGRSQLEQALNYQTNWAERLRRWLAAHPALIYLGNIFLLTALISGGLAQYGSSPGNTLLILLLTLIPSITIAINLVNWATTYLTAPRILPKLDYETGINAECCTIIVIPALLAHPKDVTSLFKQLELHQRRNPDTNLRFALLTDFADAPAQHQPEDDSLIAQAQAALQSLNEQHPDQPFYFFHRQRLWNPAEDTWMGWERKRGKLHEFNRLLRGATDTSYVVQDGRLDQLSPMRYVITLDADTILPRDAAQRLVAAIAHPLNQAQFDSTTNRVSAGYTILQPRTEIQSVSANQSLFSRVFAGDSGLDLYTMAVSDVYQDLFGEGNYVGKGIYDIDAFERSLDGRIPDNTLLSHDLFEGLYGRAGLVTDVILYEDYPSHYLTNVFRSHRWLRGDWQLLPWLFAADLSLVGRWKIADNLRRSLLAPGLLLLFIAGWTILPGSPLLWTAVGLLTPAVALLTSILVGLVRKANATSWAEVSKPMRNSAVRWLLYIAFLPYEAIIASQAILVTLHRLFISHRHLLQWTTAAQAARMFSGKRNADVVRSRMLPVLVLIVILLPLLIWVNPTALLEAIPLLLLWTLAPEIAFWISQPDPDSTETLTPEQEQQLRRLACRTWLFYKQFVGPEDNWLPPDHYQEDPKDIIAHRTSPTNIGLYLLSALAAFDFGHLSLLNLSLRLRSTLDTLNRLESHQGHFLNWISTDSLASLSPRYISTVDSGNLAGCLIALKEGCYELKQQPVWGPSRWQGLIDTLDLLAESLAQADPSLATSTQTVREMLQEWQQQIKVASQVPAQWASLLNFFTTDKQQALNEHFLALVEDQATIQMDAVRDWRLYLHHLLEHLRDMQRELDSLLPWLQPFSHIPPFLESAMPPALTAVWQTLQDTIPEHIPSLAEHTAVCHPIHQAATELKNQLDQLESTTAVTQAQTWCTQLLARLAITRLTSQTLLDELDSLAQQAESLVQAMDFNFLYDPQRQVFHIGYNLETGRLDSSYYDLLASEARIASLVAIARYDVPLSHWLHLGRPLTQVHDGRSLLSWSGTMFEYLMPTLLMHSYKNTLLHQSYLTVVDHQIRYGRSQNVPWGISESGFYTFDASQNYQYHAFGVPGLGFKRGLTNDLVIAPYASLMALPYRPQAVLENIAHLRQYKMLGRYGLHEALDFTPAHLPLGEEAAIICSYMAHHQGMILLALANYLHGNKMIRRFHADPGIQSVELLLQEQIPAQVPLQDPHADEEKKVTQPTQDHINMEPWSVPLHTPSPQVHYLSNGRLHTLISNSGSGYSQWNDIALTRWRADATQDDWGCWLYVQDEDSGALWSAGSQPIAAEPDHSDVQFQPHKAVFQRRDHQITLKMEITIAPDDDVEIRRYSLTNSSNQVRHLRLTSYGEVVLAPPAGDQRHPAFAKLFVESDYLPHFNALLFRRRPRSAHEDPHFLAHMLLVEPGQNLTRAYESDREKFLGRGFDAHRPQALHQPQWLSGTVGATLDPVMALGQTLTLEPQTTVQIATITLAAATRTQVEELLQRHQAWNMLDRTFGEARTQAEQNLRNLKLDSPDVARFQQLLSLLIFPHRAGRASPDVLAANHLGQPALWAFGISGDNPILLVHIHEEVETELVLELLKAHRYWRRRGLHIALVLLNQQETNYGQDLQGHINRLIHYAEGDDWLQRRGGIFTLRRDQMSEEHYVLLQTAARLVLYCRDGSLPEQIDLLQQRAVAPTPLPPLDPSRDPRETEPVTPLPRPNRLQFDNGWGGFSPDGREYQIYLHPGRFTPAPWINVIANENFGFLASETGGGYSWAVNSGENRLTTWRNDPVSDEPAEALYIRDEETAEFWSPTPRPAPANAPYLVCHGAGYTEYEHHSHGLQQRLRLFAAPEDPVKIVQLHLENTTQRPRRFTVTYYAEWVLGNDREGMAPFILPSYYEDGAYALLATNPYNVEFAQRVAFMATSRLPHGLTADRTEFLGRGGTLRQPAALSRVGLAGRVEAGLDPCAAMQLHVDLPPGRSKEIYFLLGQGEDRTAVTQLLEKYSDEQQVAAAWQAVHDKWEDILGTVRVDTPDAAFNLLLNRWLLYQALACRIWGRSALYQSSGAYGYRDQLQDVLSVLHTRPDVARAQILRAAAHQFEAGDVLHWWHPPAGRGVRTRISDDLLWLPYVVSHYVAATGDTAVLDEQIPFLRGKPLADDEEERYGLYEQTEASYSLYEHCCRVLAKGSTHGRHNLPLMGAGDWNDGMNRVGIEGKGESIWLGWFLHTTLTKFADLCAQRGDKTRAQQYRQQAEAYRQALEEHGWDGHWYRRAYYDDGTPLGSAQNKECQIDAIAQSWGIISGAADPERARQAMAAVRLKLVREEDRLLLLFTPPFDKSPHDPGYIKGYPPGIRENGGQYTHAALWTIWALAEMGEGETAVALYKLINPIYRADTPAKAAHYQVEPYVIAADVYGVEPHVGRGGWTWYTGSSGWMYRLGVEAILGLTKTAAGLRISPRITPDWYSYSLTYRHHKTTYEINVSNPERLSQGVKSVTLNGQEQPDGLIPWLNDGQTHIVEIVMGKVAEQEKQKAA